MALRAIRTQPARVRILMARNAIFRQAQPGFGEVSKFDLGSLCRTNMCRCVALFARDAGVLAFEQVPGLTVIEAIERNVPMDQIEVHAIVFGMAP